MPLYSNALRSQVGYEHKVLCGFRPEGLGDMRTASKEGDAWQPVEVQSWFLGAH